MRLLQLQLKEDGMFDPEDRSSVFLMYVGMLAAASHDTSKEVVDRAEKLTDDAFKKLIEVKRKDREFEERMKFAIKEAQEFLDKELLHNDHIKQLTKALKLAKSKGLNADDNLTSEEVEGAWEKQRHLEGELRMLRLTIRRNVAKDFGLQDDDLRIKD